MSTDQEGYSGVPGWCLDPAVIIFQQEITRVILCRLILNDIIIHMNFSNDIIMFYKIVRHFYVINFRDYVV